MLSNPRWCALEAERAGLADTIVINSCAVTNEAVAQARQSIRRLKRNGRRRASSSPAARRRRKHRCLPIWRRSIESSAMTTRCGAMPGGVRARRLTQPARSRSKRPTRLRSPTSCRSARWRRRSWKDCRRACRAPSCKFRTDAITVVPSASFLSAAAIRARCPSATAVAQVRALVERGHPEIVLTGVDLTSYGGDLEGAPKLGQLVQQILLDVPELKRLRISSVEFDRGRSRAVGRDRERRAADAASAFVAAIRR